jgi:2-amino-4-hydroxy-6-hydroxymethyldihydropteridine diphosphokinase
MLYAIALGSNRRHARFGGSVALIEDALRRLPGVLLLRSRTMASRPLGPSARTYANAAAIIESDMMPQAMLAALQAIERDLGRVRSGQKWRARTMDLDIIFWSDGVWASSNLTIPHREFRARRFVLDPLAEIVPDWRDPVTGQAVKHLRARHIKARPQSRP